ncbi:Crp/Fnr family transcriptional regulator [Parvularcula sp. ZS-1/3]|uniref:Crp/Fnr family transcriptional regulator n=1 Tax=Parvularcula mediterranea TaxID=2732508 RepID=A0A7Y3RQ06_9PROT|nr:Crp/Fnr family transcriptional regulator [Parvularcula mediterranea]NNU17262.1 Crp/Fnr family transcriptional regulator [Parvularcula mediterranea]
MSMRTDALFKRLSHYTTLHSDMAEVLDQICAESRTFGPGDVIVERGAEAEEAFVVCKGWASRSIGLGDGRKQVVNFMLPGDLFDLQVFVGQKADHTVAALTDLEIAAVSRDRVLELFSSGSALAPGIWWSTVQEESILREQIVRNGRRSARERVSHLLLELHARLAIIGEAEENSFVMPIGQMHVADALGLSYVHVSRVFSFLEKSNLISRHRSEVIFKNREALEDLADFSSLYLHLDANNVRLLQEKN